MKYYSLTEEEKTRLCRLENRLHANAYELADKVAEMVKKFDGKYYNKRLATAIHAIDPHLFLQTQYNSFNIKYIAIEYEERSITTASGNTDYIDNSEVYIAGMCISSQDDHRALTEDGRIIADNIIKEIERTKEYNKETYNTTEGQLSQVNYFRLRKERIKAEAEAHNNEVCYHIRQYFDLELKTNR